MARGENRIAIGWFGAGASALFMLVFFMVGEIDGVPGCCFWLVVSLFIANSGHEAKKKAKQRQVIYVPQVPVQQVVHHTYHQAPVAKPKSTSTRKAPAKSQAEWAMDARNLEMARDWEKAAHSYQKAGLFAEAGRIRQNHMEKDDSQVKIKIDRIGDNIQDSVAMKDGDSQNDPNQP